MINERNAEYRAARAPMRTIREEWRRAAKRWAAANGRDAKGVLDMLEEIASLYLYGGDTWDIAQARAWSDVVEILSPRAEAGAA